jgi:hypothetical protein
MKTTGTFTTMKTTTLKALTAMRHRMNAGSRTAGEAECINTG